MISFFLQLTASLHPNDYFLLGIDLQKEISILEAAYNDSQGVTAQFNLNMLEHLNHRFNGNFDVAKFRHQAIYNSELHQIEMYLNCIQSHSVNLEDLSLDVTLAEKETIRTEISRKFNLEQMKSDLTKYQLETVESWIDSQFWFGLILCQYQI